MKTTTEYSSRPLLMAIVLLSILAPLIAVAHTDLTDRLDVLNHKIKNNPQSLILYVERGKVFGLRGSYRDALKDYQYVLNLEPDNVEVKLEAGIVFLKLGQPKKSLALFSEIVKKYPAHQLALLNRARAFRHMGDHQRAALDYERALNLLHSPKPDDYIEIANHYVEYGESHYDLALAQLDSAMNKLGVLVQLQSRAIEIDYMKKNYPSILQRIDILLTTLNRKEKWLARKAEILVKMDKQCEAKENYHLALKLLTQLPASRRNVKAMKDLKEKITVALLDINNGQSDCPKVG